MMFEKRKKKKLLLRISQEFHDYHDNIKRILFYDFKK